MTMGRILFGIEGASMGFVDAFYKYLDDHNEERGWQSEFARRAGISQSALSKVIKRATKDPGITMVGAIVDTIGDEFFEPLLSYTPSKSESARALKKRIEDLERENGLLRDLVAAQKRIEALEKNSAAQQLPPEAERRALPPVEE